MKKLLSIILLTCSLCAMAKEYRIYVPNSAGSGGGDTVARQLAESYYKKTGNTLVVTNVPGGNHVVAVNAYKNDSHISLIVVTSTMMVWNHLNSVPYSDLDFNVIAELGASPFFYFANTASGITNPQELTTRLNSNPTIFIGHHDTAGSFNIAFLSKFVNPAIRPIPYKSPADVILGVVSNTVQVGVVSGAIVQLEELEKAGKIKIIGSTFLRPLEVNNHWALSMSQVLKVSQFNGYVGIAVSPGDTAEHQQLIQDIHTIMKTKEIQDTIANLQYKPTGSNPPMKFILEMRQKFLENQDITTIR
jgi:tripartite-type tricarboxylate transporter receptor subunit TctC